MPEPKLARTAHITILLLWSRQFQCCHRQLMVTSQQWAFFGPALIHKYAISWPVAYFEPTQIHALAFQFSQRTQNALIQLNLTGCLFKSYKQSNPYTYINTNNLIDLAVYIQSAPSAWKLTIWQYMCRLPEGHFFPLWHISDEQRH